MAIGDIGFGGTHDWLIDKADLVVSYVPGDESQRISFADNDDAIQVYNRPLD